MLRQVNGAILTYQFEGLQRHGLVHAVFGRLGGVSEGPLSSLNVGSQVGDDPQSVAENKRRACAHLGVDTTQVVTAHQVHGNHVAAVDTAHLGQVMSNTDGLVTDAAHVALMLRFADCQPIILFDPLRHALGLVHAGWRGVALGIAYRAVEAMTREFGSRPEDLLAGLGPAIGPCCYTVGHQVAAALGYALPDWSSVMTQEEDSWRFDLPAANAQQLATAGVQSLEQAGLCTACRTDEFYSHRASQGKTGRFAVLAYLGPSPAQARARTTRTAFPEAGPTEAASIGSLSPPGMPGLGDHSGEPS